MAENDSTQGQVTGTDQPGAVISPGSDVPAEPATPFVFRESNQADALQTQQPSGGPESQISEVAPNEVISWTASEFIAHEKSASWYLGLAGAAVLLAAIIYLFTKDYISSGVVLFGAFLLGVMAARKPRQQQYSLDAQGINIGPRRLAYEEFRSFAIVPEGAFSGIVLLPLKRFALLTTIYYAPENEEQIVRLLSAHLPFDEHHLDVVDRLMRRIRF
jgi:hypothetical protein